MDQKEVNKLILDNLSECTSQINKMASEMSDVKVGQQVLAKEHERMNDTLVEHVRRTDLSEQRLKLLEDERMAKKAIKEYLKDKRTWILFFLGATGTLVGILKTYGVL